MTEYNFMDWTSVETADRLLDRAIVVLNRYVKDEDVLHRIMITLSEAITNACFHGNQMSDKKSIRLTISINESDITADIIDQGKGGLKRIENRQPSEQMSESGRGIDLICHYSSEAAFSVEDDGGLRVSITFPRIVKSEVTH